MRNAVGAHVVVSSDTFGSFPGSFTCRCTSGASPSHRLDLGHNKDEHENDASNHTQHQLCSDTAHV